MHRYPLGPDEGEIDTREAEDALPVTPATAEFVLEAHLEEFLLGNWNTVDRGRPLRIWQSAEGNQRASAVHANRPPGPSMHRHLNE